MGQRHLEEMEESFDIRINEAVFNAVPCKCARKSRDARRRLARLCNRGMDEEYHGRKELRLLIFIGRIIPCFFSSLAPAALNCRFIILP